MMFAGRSKQQYENTRRTPSRGKRRHRQKKSWEDNIIKVKEWIKMDCASMTTAGENRGRWREASWSSRLERLD